MSVGFSDGHETKSVTQLPTGDNINYEYNALMSALEVSVSKHLLNEAYTMVWANDFYYDLIRFPKEEYTEKFYNQPNIYYSTLGYEDELDKVREAVVTALTQGKSGYTEISRMPVKGGGHVWVQMKGIFTQEYINGYQVTYTVITNIDDFIQMEREKSITYNNMPGFSSKFLIKDNLEMEVLDANEQFKEFFGMREDTMDAFHQLFDENLERNRRKISAKMQQFKNGKPVNLFLRLYSLDGREAWMQVSGECVDWIGGNPVYLVIYIDVTDLTDLRKMQQKLEQQADQLRAALQEAEEANRAKSDFLSRMSHDIRTPMNAIVGMTEIASTHLEDADRVKDCLRKISISSQHLLGLINNVLDMSKIESGKMALQEEPISLPEILEDIVAILQPMVKSRNQHFSIRLHHLYHEDYLCDSLRLRQCFINILSNASKFTPKEGNIAMDVEENPSQESGRANLTFQFSDSGIGMSPEFVEHIFDPFSRALDGTVEKTEGCGLGMNITKKIVDLMDGTIAVDSKPGEGTVFTIKIPMQIDHSKAQEMDLILPKLKILIVDDDEVMCDYTTQTLNECGIDTRWCSSGKAAMQQVLKAHRENQDFDAVILDWKMPDMDGLETVKKIRTELKSEIPIMIISSYDWNEIEKEALKAGASGFLSKPLFRSTLLHGIYKYVLGQEIQKLRHSSQDSYDFSGRKILLVEDNAINSEIAIELLEETGAKVEAAANGLEGVEKFKASAEGYYDLILMDIQMPEMDGYTATGEIRRLPRKDASAVPILAMTADVFAEDVAAAKESGMNGHISKPININSMKKEICEILRCKEEANAE